MNPNMLVLILMLFLYNLSIAQEKISSPVKAPVNELVTYDVDLSCVQIGKPFFVEYSLPPNVLQILEVSSNIQAEAETDVSIVNLSSNQFKVSVIPYSINSYPMPSILVTVLDNEQKTNHFYTPSFSIPISNTVITETNLSFSDIESVYFVWNHLWTVLILLLLLIVLGYFFAYKFFKITPKPKKAIIKIDPYVQVHQKLTKLQMDSIVLTDDTYKEFFVELSETVRDFLSETTVPLALELPTSELLTQLKKLYPNNTELNEVVALIVRSTDRAKYAKQIFSEDRITSMLNESFRMVAIIQQQHQGEQSHEL